MGEVSQRAHRSHAFRVQQADREVSHRQRRGRDWRIHGIVNLAAVEGRKDQLGILRDQLQINRESVKRRWVFQRHHRRIPEAQQKLRNCQ